MSKYLLFSLQMSGENQISVTLTASGFTKVSGCSNVSPLPFNLDELRVAVRAIEINQGVSETFEQSEWILLKEWGVVSQEFQPDPHSNEMSVTDKQVDIKKLLDLVQDRLFRTLFGGEGVQQLDRALVELERSEILDMRIRLPSNHVILYQYPWETLCSSNNKYFKGTLVSIVRIVEYGSIPNVVEQPEQINILMIKPRPEGVQPLPSDDFESIWQGFKDSPPRYRVTAKPPKQLNLLTVTSTKALLGKTLNELKHDSQICHILHFDGHGEFARKCLSDENHHIEVDASVDKCPKCGGDLSDHFGHLAFEKIVTTPKNAQFKVIDTPPEETKVVYWISSHTFAEMIKGHPVKLVFMNTCLSAVGRRSENIFNGLAQALIQAGVPAVIGTGFRVLSDAANKFSSHFYHRLGEKGSLIDALCHARQQLVGGREWYRFMLYLGQESFPANQFISSTVSRDSNSRVFPKEKGLSRECLSNWDLRNADLQGANLSHSLLVGADLSSVNLIGAILTETYLSGANLTAANMSKVDLSQTILSGTLQNRTVLRNAKLLSTLPKIT